MSEQTPEEELARRTLEAFPAENARRSLEASLCVSDYVDTKTGFV